MATDTKRFEPVERPPLTTPLEILRSLLGRNEKLDLAYQQFFRAVERVDKARTPATKDVQRICDELLKTLVSSGALRREDMQMHPLVIAGMAQMLLLICDALPFGETVAMKDEALFKQSLRMLLDCTVSCAIGHGQLMAQAAEQGKDAVKQ